ncbi:MAG: short-chain dehydrogenase [Polaromonas sp.]|nr:short-chain dehydrogenase [Polaromonas sp.]
MSQRWVLVTGGGRRLGRECCLAFARADWNVVCHYQSSFEDAQDTCRAVALLGRKAIAIAADLSRSADREALMAKAAQATGRHLDAVVNNASVFEPDGGIDFSPDLLHRQLEVNLVAPLHLGSLLARSLQGYSGMAPPAVIHVLDQKVFNPNPDYFSYTVSKLALERTVALQAQSLAPHVRVTAIAPGLIYVSGPQNEENFQKARSVNLLRSPINPVDVARTAVFLAENESMTGVTLCIDKGQHLVPLERDIMFVTDQLMQKPS